MIQQRPEILTPIPPDIIELTQTFCEDMGLDFDRQHMHSMMQELYPQWAKDTTEQTELLWQPISEPQRLAIETEADETFFGGRAGCGKTYLLIGAAATGHKTSIIFRKEYTQLEDIILKSREMFAETGASFNGQSNMWSGLPGGRHIKFGACAHDKDLDKFRGREHDLVAFDELATFTEYQYLTLTAWARTTDPHQRVRIIAAGNPPTEASQYWVKRRWGAWLDDRHPKPAMPGELRWYVNKDGKDVEVESPEPVIHDGEELTPLSRTFIPGQMLELLKGTNYEARLQQMPEPLRSQLLFGDFSIAEDDQARQVIPTEHVRLAFQRWEKMTQPTETLRAMGVDVSRGGRDATVIAKQYDNYFTPLTKLDAAETKTGDDVAASVMENLTDDEKQASIVLDLTGVGSSPYDILISHQYNVDGFVGASKSSYTDKAGRLNFVNRRAEAWWKFREALDPTSGEDIALPPDSELMADLTSPTWKLATRGIQIEEKEEIIKRLGRSPDAGDAVVMCYNATSRGSGDMIII